jgi:hypothetical protein
MKLVGGRLRRLRKVKRWRRPFVARRAVWLSQVLTTIVGVFSVAAFWSESSWVRGNVEFAILVLTIFFGPLLGMFCVLRMMRDFVRFLRERSPHLRSNGPYHLAILAIVWLTALLMANDGARRSRFTHERRRIEATLAQVDATCRGRETILASAKVLWMSEPMIISLLEQQATPMYRRKPVMGWSCKPQIRFTVGETDDWFVTKKWGFIRTNGLPYWGYDNEQVRLSDDVWLWSSLS